MERVQKIAVSVLIISVFSFGCSKKDDKSSKNLLIGAAALNAGKNVGSGTTVTATAPSGLSYSGSPFSFIQKTAITTATPTVTGTVTACTSSPALPAGLSLNAATCALSGTPTAVQSSASYTITATNSAGSTTTSISIFVSSDASGWTARTLPSSSAWQSVTYGNGVFVAVAQGTAAAASSTDGINWTARTMPSSSNWYSVTYGNGIFVAVTIGPSTAAASSP